MRRYGQTDGQIRPGPLSGSGLFRAAAWCGRLHLVVGFALVIFTFARDLANAQPAVIDRPTPTASRFVGRVTDLATDRPISGARVGAGSAHAVTGVDGRYALTVPPGRYDLRVTAAGYQGATVVARSVGVSYSRDVRPVAPDTGGSVTVDIGLPPLIADDQAIRMAAGRLRAMAVPAASGGVETMLHTRPPAASASAGESEPTPRDVRILMPDGSIVQVEMDEYLKGVVPVEMGYVFRRSFEALRAQAIASRTYAATSCLPASAGDPSRCERGLDANVDTTTRTQAWGPVHYDISDAAVESTHGQVARLDGRIVQSLFFARTVGRTLDSESSPCCGGRTFSYLRSAWSPDAFDARLGHGTGMSQEGAAVLADWGATAEEIIEHYYRGTEVGGTEGAAVADAAQARPIPADGADPPPSQEADDPGTPKVLAGAMVFDAERLTLGPSLGAVSVLPFDTPAIEWLEGPATEADFPFMALAARWRRAPTEAGETSPTDQAGETSPTGDVEEGDAAGGDARLMIRVSDDGVDWSEWTPLLPDEGDGRSPEEMAGDDPIAMVEEAESGWTRLLVARGRFVQLRIALLPGPDGTVPAVAGVTLHYLDADEGPNAPETSVRTQAADEALSVQSIEDEIIPRSAWGADESLRFDSAGAQIWPPFYTAPRAQIVHHTVTTNDPVDPAAVMRSIYHFHAVTRGWGDIGYNFLIDHRGNVYQGRFGGERDGRISQGGHARQYNSNSIGVALLGTFTASGAEPSERAEAALVDILAAKGVRYSIDPVAPVTLVGTRFPHAVMGHRDALPGHTACPGLGVHEQLNEIRSRVAARMSGAGPAPTTPPTTPPTATPRPTPTLAPPSTAVPTRTPVPGATPDPSCAEIVSDGGFETSDPKWQRNRAWFTAWDVLRGNAAMFVGLRNNDPDEATTYASAAQMLQVPADVASAELTYFARTSGQASDRRLVRLFDESGAIAALSGVTLPATSGWQEWRHDVSAALAAREGGRVRLYFGVINDGDGRRSYMRLDDVSLRVCGGVGPASPTAITAPTELPESTSTIAAATASPTPTETIAASTELPEPTETAEPTVTIAAPTVPPEPEPSATIAVPTALPEACTDAIKGGDFEADGLGPWRVEGDHTPGIVDAPGAARSGVGAVRLGRLEAGGFGYSAIAQRPADIAGAESAMLSLWVRPERMADGDALVVELRRPIDGIRRSLVDAPPPTGEWVEFAAPLLPEEVVDGIEVYAAVLNRGAAAPEGESAEPASTVLIDDLSLVVCRQRTFRQIFPRLFGRPGDPLTRP